ncbi:MAG: PIN domain-containing protein [Candidatus Hydrothermarchaeales archaeon]
MKKIGSSYFIDSSAWLSYLYGESERPKEIVESGAVLFTSVLSLFEIKRKLLSEGHTEEEILGTLKFIKERSIVRDLKEEQAEKAGEISFEEKLHAIDALIYTSALDVDATLISCDTDFQGLRNVEMI